MRIVNLITIFLGVLALGLNLNPAFSLAQFGQDLFEQPLQMSLSPQLPSPFEQYTISVDDYALGNGGSRIEWTIDGEFQTNLINVRKISLTAPDVGQVQTIKLRVIGNNGSEATVTREVRPFYLDVIIEPQTYAPSLYQGRTLATFGSQVLITTLLHDAGGLVDPSTLTYTWTLVNKVLDGGPVKGKFRNIVTVPYGRDILIGVSVADNTGAVVARRLLSFPSVEVDLHFYEVNSLYGLSHVAISDRLLLLGNGTTIKAVPYNLDKNVDSSRLFSEWKINNRRVQTGNDPFEFTFVKDGFGSSDRLNFKLRHLDALLQGDEGNILIEY